MLLLLVLVLLPRQCAGSRSHSGGGWGRVWLRNEREIERSRKEWLTCHAFKPSFAFVISNLELQRIVRLQHDSNLELGSSVISVPCKLVNALRLARIFPLLLPLFAPSLLRSFAHASLVSYRSTIPRITKWLVSLRCVRSSAPWWP